MKRLLIFIVFLLPTLVWGQVVIDLSDPTSQASVTIGLPNLREPCIR